MKLLTAGGRMHWGYAAVLSLAFAALVVTAVQSYRTIDREFTDLALSRRTSVSYLAAAVLSEKLDRLADIGIALATRVRFRELVETGNWTEAGKILSGVPNDFPFIERTTLHDRDGTIMADIPEIPGMRGKNFAHRDWYREAMYTGKPYVSQVFRRAAPPRMNVFVVAIPIQTAKSEILGILVLQIRLDRFFEWAANIEVGPGGLVYVVDQRGQLAAHPKFPPQGDLIDYSGVPAVRRVLTGGRGVDVVFNPVENERRVIAYEPATKYGWGVVLEQPATSVFATRDSQLRRILTAYGLMLVFVVCVVFLASRIFAQRRLVEDSQRAKAALERAVAERTAQLETVKNEIEDLYDNAPCGYHSLDRDGVFVRINNTELSWLGYVREEILGRKKFSDLLTPESAARFIATFPRFKETGRVDNLEFEMVRKDGSALPVALSATVVRDAAGNYLASRSTIFDIAERARSEKRFRGLLESAPDALIIVNGGGNIVLLNAQAEKIFGYPRDELIGKPIETLVPERFRPRHPEYRDTYFANPAVRPMGGGNFDLWARRRDGTEFPVEISLSPLETEEGTVVTAAVRDITERRRSEQEMQFLQATALETSESENTDAALLTVMRRVCELTGWAYGQAWMPSADDTRLELRGTYYSRNPELEHFWRENQALSFTPGSGLLGQIWASRQPAWAWDLEPDSGNVRRAMILEAGFRSWIAFPVVSESEVIAVIEFFEIERCDRSERTLQLLSILGAQLGSVIQRKRAAEEIRELHTSLEQRAHQLEAANRELESFAYSVSHDLRSPLRAIDGFSQILEEDYAEKLDDEGRRLLDVVRGNSQKMGRLIDDLLTFSRLGRKPVVSAEIDMGALVQEVLGELRAEPGSTAAECSIQSLPAAWGDRVLLRQVWINLLTNAIKFTHTRHPPLIEVSGNRSGHETIYCVKDNGVGFDMQYYDKLFGVFQRLHSDEEFPGTGVGLAIVQRVVIRHGGRVWAEGVVDGGATFYFSLPAETQNG